MDDNGLGGGNADHRGEVRLFGTGWWKSSFSASNGHCVEVARLTGGFIGVRDSKAKGGPVLQFSTDDWASFLDGIRDA